MAKKYIKDGEVFEESFVAEKTIKGKDGKEKRVRVRHYNAKDEEWRAAGYLPVTEYYEKLINEKKQSLLETDYIALKAVEGYDVDSLYPNWKQKRNLLREEINALENKRDNLLD